MKHSFTFTTRRYLRESDKSITTGKLQYIQRSGKIPWQEIGAYMVLILLMLIVAQLSQLVYEMIPFVIIIASAHVIVYVSKSFRYMRMGSKIRKPVSRMKKDFKGYFKIKLRFDDQLCVILYKDDLSETHSTYQRSDLLEVTAHYLHLAHKKHELIIPKSLFIHQEFENMIAYFNDQDNKKEVTPDIDLNKTINDQTPLLVDLMSDH